MSPDLKMALVSAICLLGALFTHGLSLLWTAMKESDGANR